MLCPTMYLSAPDSLCLGVAPGCVNRPELWLFVHVYLSRIHPTSQAMVSETLQGRTLEEHVVSLKREALCEK